MPRNSKLLSLIFIIWSSVAHAQGITPVSGSGGVGSGTVTSIATSCGISGGTITTTGTISAIANSAVQTGSNYAFVTGDCGTIVYLNSGSNQVPTIPQAGTTGFATGWFVEACNIGAGTQTITPATSTIGGAATYVLPAGSAAAPKCIGINSDGANYKLDLTGPYTVGTLGAVNAGTGVATAAALNLSAAGGLTTTVASGTSALGTSAISSATCATVVTTSATNTATTDVVLAGFNGDPTAVTGYVPLTTGMLTIIGYPTANNVNFKVCNNTGSSITPGAITLNWRVVR